MCWFDLVDQDCEIMQVPELKKKHYCYKCPARCSTLVDLVTRYVDMIRKTPTRQKKNELMEELIYYYKEKKKEV